MKIKKVFDPDDINIKQNRDKMKLWIICCSIFSLLYGGLLIIEALSYGGDIRVALVTILATVPLFIFAIIIYHKLPNFIWAPLVLAAAVQLVFLPVGAYLNELEFNFSVMIMVLGTVVIMKNFKLMAASVAIVAAINITAMIFFIPHLEWLNNYRFFMQFMLFLNGIVFFLILTYHVERKENNAGRALIAFSSLLQSTPNYMVIVDSNNKMQYISRPLLEFAGYSRQEFAVGRPLIDLFTDKSLKLMFADILDAGGFIETEMTIKKDGKDQHFKVIADKLPGNTGGLFIEISDITPLLNSRRNAEEAQERAETANTSKSKFLANMSHEIRTPMNAIIGISEIELNCGNHSTKTKEAFQRIHNSGYTLLGIINDILDLSKIETGKLELDPVKYDTASLINDTVQLNIMRIGSKVIEFRLLVSENLPSELIGDELRIKQILNNLLSNAIKYTDKGSVTLEIRANALHSEFGEAAAQLIIIVKDTGLGMTREQIEKIFDDYSRFNMEANRAKEGTGLGMSITKNLVQMMGGEIKLESEPGGGTTVTLHIPQKLCGSGVIGTELAEILQDFRYSNDTRTTAAQFVREYMPYGSVLIVDDVEINLYVAESLMQPYGMRIETAASGLETLEKIRGGAVYDIVFMDHMMPEMDGIETTKRLRDSGYTQPIVALTANAIVGQADIFLENGFDDYLTKPVDILQLNTVLNKYIKEKKK